MKEHNGIIIWNQLHELTKLKKHSYTLPSLTELETRIMRITSMMKHKKGVSINVKTLKTMLNVSHPTISQTVNALEKKEYISRVNDPLDGRVTLIEISKTGKKVLEESFRIITERFIELSNYLGEEKSKDFISILDDIIKYFQELGEEK